MSCRLPFRRPQRDEVIKFLAKSDDGRGIEVKAVVAIDDFAITAPHQAHAVAVFLNTPAEFVRSPPGSPNFKVSGHNLFL
jgi:hypothetical protein